ncbi:MAG: protein kinase [Enhydrobacter sp.]|nr:MAG: protein kinase [Enhydrobacter sp.]
MKEPTTDPGEGGPAANSPQGEHDIAVLPVGARIGRYEITAILGQGGFGITYRARDEQLGREVAIKEYLPTSLAFRRADATVLPRSTKVAEDFRWGRERFVSEGRTLASLHDAPGIVRVFDFMEMNGTAYIVMELVQGETLEARLRRGGRLSAREIETILPPLLDGLEKVHETGFLHRDIKPANILMGEDDRPTLIDFGASRAAMAGRTTAMTAIFTPGYAATEQFTSARQGPWTDIYGLSATLYHAITGAPPPSAFDRMLDDAYKPLARLSPPGFARGLLVGIDAGLAVRSSERPQSIAGWRSLLAQSDAGAFDATVALGQPTAPAATVALARSRPTPAAAAAPARSRTVLYAGVAAAVLLLLGVGGYVLFTGKPQPQALALHEMKAEELEKALEARRKADAEAAEKRRLEEEAQQKAAADDAAKQAADAELERTRAERQKAEEELARLQAEIEAQRKAAAEQREIAEATARRAEAEAAKRKIEAEMAALRAAEEEAQRKAAIEAEAKRLADEALARAQAERARADAEARARTDAEARQKAEADAKTRAEAEARAKVAAEKEKAEAEAKAKAEAEQKSAKATEAAEAALRLSVQDRQRLQVALTALGFNTGGSDGAFGPRSRQAIAGWQKNRREPETGFLTASQQQALLRDAAPAVAKFDDDRKKLEEEAKAKAAAAAAGQQAPTQQQAPPQQAAASPLDGTYGGGAEFSSLGGLHSATGARSVRATFRDGAGSVVVTSAKCGASTLALKVSADGAFTTGGEVYDEHCARTSVNGAGRIADGQLELRLSGPAGSLRGTLRFGY